MLRFDESGSPFAHESDAESGLLVVEFRRLVGPGCRVARGNDLGVLSLVRGT
jgi:hypothetical protein